MTQEKHGIQIFDQTGGPVLEIGPHLVRENSEFAETIGIIAASWAQAEVNLNCLFAILLDTTPDEAADQLKRYRSAARAADGARKLAAEYLTGAELESVTKALNQLDLVRLRRNRVQHDVWAKKDDDNQTMFAIHADQYLAFTTNFVAATELAIPEDEKSEIVLNLANEFAATITKGHTIRDLQEIDHELNLASKSLMEAMFFRISQRLKEKGAALAQR
ncbi:hypothetical protein AHFPHNDE_03184 [Pseudomonas sp. MM227]|uniref:hypothetical protein n=1 Tax=unclassified Pseudomonas TaxID=196821 RepID=UPI0017849426|nr:MULTISPECIES: hypothetical protein [unclassified Pseudomonas]MBD8733665.1 hypothetical protein [Pseudomonas sp. CFBP 13710]CAI3789487.1 hypothetical protein AHFPHNDE_03184 [Pseudomonas sp. MM227]